MLAAFETYLLRNKAPSQSSAPAALSLFYVPKLPISVSRAPSPVANGQFGAACRGISHCRPGVLSTDSIKAPLSAAENDTKLPVCDGKPAMPGGNGEFGVTGCPNNRPRFFLGKNRLAQLVYSPLGIFLDPKSPKEESGMWAALQR